MGEAFIEDLLDEWQRHGREALIAMRQERPGDFCRMVASILPRDIAVKHDGLEVFGRIVAAIEAGAFDTTPDIAAVMDGTAGRVS